MLNTNKLAVLCFLGMGAIAYGQSTTTSTEYDGRVGINTKMPSATLNVVSKGNTADSKSFEVENSSNKKTLTVLDSQAVGINNTSPGATLSVKSTGNTASTKAFQVQNSSNANMLNVLDNGFTGLGTATPAYRLDVSGVARASQFIGYASGNVGPSLNLINPSKTADDQFYKWTLFNMTDTDATLDGGYHNALVIWGYNYNASENITGSNKGLSGPKLVISDKGNVGIGGLGTYSNTDELDQRLVVNGNIKSTALSGATGSGNRPVYADEKGVLTVGTVTTTSFTNEATCGESTVGTVRYAESVTINGTAYTSAFGFCMKNANGTYNWFYMTSGAGVTPGSTTFGS